MTDTSKPDFNAAARRNHRPKRETVDQRAKRLDAEVKALEASLQQKPSKPTRKLTPSGQLRRDGDDYARRTLESRRADLTQEIKRIEEEQTGQRRIPPKLER
ncbi:MAG: hypothetical protein WBF53_02390 [Litorimonas sp.]